MNGFFVSITNNLLEDKHYEQMGNSVWLYMWLIDRMTEISEGIGIVNNGNPVTHEMIRQSFRTMPERTYYRMVETLRNAGYINTAKARYGLYITINKPKKQFNKRLTNEVKVVKNEASSPAKNGKSEQSSPAKNGNPVLPNLSVSPAKFGKSVNISTKTITKTKQLWVNKLTQGEEKIVKKDHHEMVSKLYYEAIKALKLPTRNHTNLKAKIKEMANMADEQEQIDYLVFVRDNYNRATWKNKPFLNEALDIHAKRWSIINTFRKARDDQMKSQPIQLGRRTKKDEL